MPTAQSPSPRTYRCRAGDMKYYLLSCYSYIWITCMVAPGRNIQPMARFPRKFLPSSLGPIKIYPCARSGQVRARIARSGFEAPTKHSNTAQRSENSIAWQHKSHPGYYVNPVLQTWPACMHGSNIEHLRHAACATFFLLGQTIHSLFGEVPHVSSPPRSCKA